MAGPKARKRARKLVCTEDLQVQHETACTSTGMGRIVFGTVTTRDVEHSKETVTPATPAPPVVPEGGIESTDYASLDYGGHSGEQNGENDTEKVKAKRYKDSDAPLLTWKKEYREEYLNWCFSSEGRGRRFDGTCLLCSASAADFRCLDCSGLEMMCRDCVRSEHTRRPLHRIECWKGTQFVSVSLQELGVRFRFGHRTGMFCNNPKTVNDFVILDVNGLHVITVDFCGCSGIEHRNQLLEVGLWPASYKEPRSAATFNLLRMFHVLNAQGHVTTTDFYRMLVQMSDGNGLRKLPDRQQQFIWMVREWRHIKMGKRAGRGHDPSGLEGTPKGITTVPCRACPQPGINLPADWESASAAREWLYGLILSIDANFKQKARARANDHRDPALGPGWGVFVDNEVYMNEVRRHTNQDEISHCVGFSAIWNANNKKSKGLRATGVGAVTCARHELFRPNGMGDLQKGERYINMDSILLMSLIGSRIRRLYISYDIACQWNLNFFERMKELPEDWQFPAERIVQFKVPKFHLQAHVEKCFAPYAFEYTEGVGEVDGEAPERTWSEHNEAASSLSMMSAGARFDTTDDKCNAWNWKKTITLDDTLLKKLIRGISNFVVYTRAFSAFTEALTELHSSDLIEWERMVCTWEQATAKGDGGAVCPYDLPASTITLAKVKKSLADEEHVREKRGENVSGTSMSAMISEALDIEDNQRLIAALASQSKQSLYQETDVLKRRVTLLQRIRRFRETQRIHMPGLDSHLPAPSGDIEAEDTNLQLPSSLTADVRTKVCSEKLIDIEDRLRYAQAHECVIRLRGQLQARTLAYKHTNKSGQSQAMWTKMNTLRAQIDARIQALRGMYDRAREALLRLRGPGEWEKVLRVLKSDDIRGIGERFLREEEKEEFRRAQKKSGVDPKDIEALLLGKADTLPMSYVDRTIVLTDTKADNLSWIWYTLNERDDGKEVEASLRVEWCRARARARRAREEVLLVDEEMRRSIDFSLWKSRWWMSQAGRRQAIAPWHAEGLLAYAMDQSTSELTRANAWYSRLLPIRHRATAILLWIDNPTRGLDTYLHSPFKLTPSETLNYISQTSACTNST